jgi:hypothetical protein
MSVKEIINNYSLSQYLEYVKSNNIGDSNISIPYVIFTKLMDIVINVEPQVVNITSDYTALITDQTIISDAATEITITLPDVTLLLNRTFIIRNNSGENLNVQTTNSQLINDGTSIVIATTTTQQIILNTTKYNTI